MPASPTASPKDRADDVRWEGEDEAGRLTAATETAGCGSTQERGAGQGRAREGDGNPAPAATATRPQRGGYGRRREKTQRLPQQITALGAKPRIARPNRTPRSPHLQPELPVPSTPPARHRTDAAETPDPDPQSGTGPPPPTPPLPEPNLPPPWTPSSDPLLGPGSLPLTRSAAPATHLSAVSSPEPRGRPRGSRVDSKYRAKVQPTKTSRRPSRGRISAPAPGLAEPRKNPQAAPGLGCARPAPAERIRRRTGAGSAPSPAPGARPRPQRGLCGLSPPVEIPAETGLQHSQGSLPSFRLRIFSPYLPLSLSLLICRLFARRWGSRGDSGALPTASL